MRQLPPLLLLAVVGCGDGATVGELGEGTLRSGRFEPGPVTGLRYQTASYAGLTTAQGEFAYEVGEEVTFSIGDVVLGTAEGKEVLTPFDLAGIEPPTEALEVRRAINGLAHYKGGAPFETALNIAELLQTIDDDRDAATGVQISERLHDLASGFDIDLKQDGLRFHSGRPFNLMIDRANNLGLWPATRSKPASYAIVAGELYDGLGLSAAIAAPLEEAVAKGSAAPAHDRYYGIYDPNGRRVEVALDGDGDAPGGITSRRMSSIDDEGCSVSETDSDGDGPGGVTSWARSCSFDNGLRRIVEFDDDGDGAGEISERRTTTWSADRLSAVSEVDGDGDGPGGITERIFGFWDEEDRVWTQDIDSDGDGPEGVQERVITFYDESNRATGYEIDPDGDGPVGIVYRVVYHYDERGFPTVTDTDIDGDGPNTIIWRDIDRWDENGNLIEQAFDPDGDGPIGIRRRESFSYDADGTRISEASDPDGDGPDEVDRFTSYVTAPIDRWGAAYLWRDWSMRWSAGP